MKNNRVIAVLNELNDVEQIFVTLFMDFMNVIFYQSDTIKWWGEEMNIKIRFLLTWWFGALQRCTWCIGCWTMIARIANACWRSWYTFAWTRNSGTKWIFTCVSITIIWFAFSAHRVWFTQNIGTGQNWFTCKIKVFFKKNRRSLKGFFTHWGTAKECKVNWALVGSSLGCKCMLVVLVCKWRGNLFLRHMDCHMCMCCTHLVHM